MRPHILSNHGIESIKGERNRFIDEMLSRLVVERSERGEEGRHQSEENQFIVRIPVDEEISIGFQTNLRQERIHLVFVDRTPEKLRTEFGH